METWKAIPGFPGYEVSDRGRVRSLERAVMRRGFPWRVKPCILNPRAGGKGHLYVNLRKPGGYESHYVHRLVAFAFLGAPPEGKPCAAHWDGDPTNNDVNNLRWASYAENSADSIRHGTSGRPSGTAHYHSKITDDGLRAAFRLRGTMSDRRVAISLGIRPASLYRVFAGKAYRKDLARLGIIPHPPAPGRR